MRSAPMNMRADRFRSNESNSERDETFLCGSLRLLVSLTRLLFDLDKIVE
jgi:hypothetical protein